MTFIIMVKGNPVSLVSVFNPVKSPPIDKTAATNSFIDAQNIFWTPRNN